MAKVITLPKRNVIKLLLDANRQVRDSDNKNFLKEEYDYLKDRQNILKKQIIIIQLLSDNNIKLFDEIKNIQSDKIKELLLDGKNSVFYSALNFLPKPSYDEITNPLLKEEDKSQYINNLTNQKLHDHYQDQINNLNLELKYIKNIIKILKESSDNINSKLLATPNIFPRVVEGNTKNMNLLYLYKTKQEAIDDLRIMLQDIAPLYSTKLEGYTNKELKDFIKNNSQEILTYIEGAKLSILEDRAFCALRYLAVKAFEKGSVISPSVKITCKLSDIYKLSGLLYNNGYDTKQRRNIKNVITTKDGNLRKPIHIEISQKHEDGNAILSTNFVKYVNWNDEKDQIIYEIDSMFFVNVPDQLHLGYWNDDIEGRNRYMTKGFDKGFQNENAYRLHRYLASSLRKKLSFNVTKLLEQSGLITYLNKGNRTLVLSKLQEYLEIMYEQKTLLKNKPIRISSKSDKYGKYELKRL